MHAHCLHTRILVIDDHVELAENIAEILDGVGYTTIVAESAEAALARLPSLGVDVLITDYKLPGLSGAELLYALAQQGARVPAVVMSAYTDAQTVATARSAGACAVIAKPVDIAALLAALQDILRTGADAALVAHASDG